MGCSATTAHSRKWVNGSEKEKERKRERKTVKNIASIWTMTRPWPPFSATHVAWIRQVAQTGRPFVKSSLDPHQCSQSQKWRIRWPPSSELAKKGMIQPGTARCTWSSAGRSRWGRRCSRRVSFLDLFCGAWTCLPFLSNNAASATAARIPVDAPEPDEPWAAGKLWRAVAKLVSSSSSVSQNSWPTNTALCSWNVRNEFFSEIHCWLAIVPSIRTFGGISSNLFLA